MVASVHGNPSYCWGWHDAPVGHLLPFRLALAWKHNLCESELRRRLPDITARAKAFAGGTFLLLSKQRMTSGCLDALLPPPCAARDDQSAW